MKIMILCHDFAPMDSAGALRPLGWVRHLWKLNCEVTVLTTSTEPDVPQLNRQWAEVIRVEKSETPISRLARRQGLWGVPFLRKALRLLSILLSHLSFSSWDDQNALYERASCLLEQGGWDWVITTAEPFILFRYGFLLKKNHRIRWCADYRDLWLFRMARGASRWWEKLPAYGVGLVERHFEKLYVSQADLVITTVPHLVQKLEAQHGREVHLVPNGYELATLPEGPRVRDRNGLPLRLIHLGVLYSRQRVEVLIDALALLQKRGMGDDVRVDFIGLGTNKGQVERIFEACKKRGLGPKAKIELTERMPRDQALGMCKTADYLLVFSEKGFDAFHRKVFDYLEVGRPILLVPKDEFLLSEFLATCRAGVSVPSAGDLADLLERAVEKKKRSEEIENLEWDRVKIAQYSNEARATQLLDLLGKHARQ